MDDELELMEFESCPKCGFDNNEDAESCGRCGIVFSKYDPATAPENRSAPTRPEAESAHVTQPSSHPARSNSGSTSSDGFSDGAFDNLSWGKIAIVVLVLGAVGYWWMSQPYEVVGADLGEGTPTVILLHGHGAQGDDMVPVAEMLSEGAPNTTFVVSPGPHSKMLGRSWMNGGTRKETNAQVAQSHKVILDAIEDVEKAGGAPEDIYIGGFSQGGQMAIELVGGEPIGRQLGGVIVMSGGWPNWPSDVPPIKGDNLAPGARAFMTHGTGDNIFPPRQAKMIAKQLRDQGVETQLEIFSGGHTVKPELVEKAAVFLSEH